MHASRETHRHFLKESKKNHEENRRHHLASGGKASEENLIRRAVREHESHLHKGESKTKLKFKSGGHVDGEHGKKRLDRADGGRTNKPKGKGGNHVNVIVAGGGHDRPPMPGTMGAPPPMMPPRPPMGPVGAPPPATGMMAGLGAPRAPGMGPPVAAGVPIRRRGGGIGRARGGKIDTSDMTGKYELGHDEGKDTSDMRGALAKGSMKGPTIKGGEKYPIDDGAGGGEGRLEKIKAYGKNADKPEGRM